MDTMDLDILARTLYGEARGEFYKLDGGILSLIAVGNVVMNRLKQKNWFGKTIQEVCQKKHQFSCWNPNDANYAQLLRAEEEPDIFAVCCQVAEGVARQNWPDVTRGADHYCTKSLERPVWATGKKPVFQISNHIFFKLLSV